GRRSDKTASFTLGEESAALTPPGRTTAGPTPDAWLRFGTLGRVRREEGAKTPVDIYRYHRCALASFKVEHGSRISNGPTGGGVGDPRPLVADLRTHRPGVRVDVGV